MSSWIPNDNDTGTRYPLEFMAAWRRCYRWLSPRRGQRVLKEFPKSPNWPYAAKLYDYMLYRSMGLQRFKFDLAEINMTNQSVMRSAGLSKNTMAAAKAFLHDHQIALFDFEGRQRQWTAELRIPYEGGLKWAFFTSDYWNTNEYKIILKGTTKWTQLDDFEHDENPIIEGCLLEPNSPVQGVTGVSRPE